MSDQRGRTLPIPVNDGDRKLLADVQGHGWHVINVVSDDEGPAFSYSIGLYENFGHPEVIVFGLSIDVMHLMINGIGDRIKEGGRYGDVDESGDVLEGYNVIFRTVELKHYPEYFGYANWFYQGDQFPALQCIWPDSLHRFPWHHSFNQSLAARQPILSDDRSWLFQAGRNRAVFTTKPVSQLGQPVLLVFHDREGDWQFSCGTTNEQKDMQLVSLGAMVQRDSTLAQVADLPEGWCAFRPTGEAEWQREPMEPEEGQ
jgi:hypothetical protein